MSVLFQCRVSYGNPTKTLVGEYVELTPRLYKEHHHDRNKASITDLLKVLGIKRNTSVSITFTSEDFVYEKFYQTWEKNKRREVEIAGTTIVSTSDYEKEGELVEHKTVSKKISCYKNFSRYADAVQTVLHAAVKSYVEEIPVKPFLLYAVRKTKKGKDYITSLIKYPLLYENSDVITPKTARELLERIVGVYREALS